MSAAPLLRIPVRSAPALLPSALYRTCRERAQLSQVELAHRVGVDSSFISRIEAGTRQPSRAVLEATTRALHLPADERDALLLAFGFAPEMTILREIADALSACEDAMRYARGIYLLQVARDALTGAMP
jgi:transcriptional regulator with XRE-family HTH domain